MAENLIKITLAAILLSCSVQDILKKKIFLWVIIVGIILVGIFIPFTETYSLPDRIGGVVIGIIMVVTSIATVGKIGMGDALLLCITGLGLGFWQNLEFFAIALLLASIVSIVLLILKLANRKSNIPFVPFMLVSYIFMLFAGR